MWFEIPEKFRDQFLSLGAKRVSRLNVDGELGDNIYVWDVADREIGYYCIPTNAIVIFKPAFRKWDDSSLQFQQFKEITC